MKIISTGSIYRIYNDHVRTHDKLPAQIYIVRFNQFQGFFLEEHSDIEIHEDKIYGVHLKKVEKVMKAFDKTERNLGVILSGDKGIGKSLFAKLLSRESVRTRDLPVIIIDQFIPGIHNFIEEIEQEAIILFDEFDKTFAAPRNNNDDNTNPQATLLSLLDGIAAGKKMYVVTCNSFQNLNDYFINRPGRFKYHFRFEYPTAAEIKEYLQDKLDKKFWDEIVKVVSFSAKVRLNYDCLRAIADELQDGEKFEDAIGDLNILNVSEQRYDIKVKLSDGTEYEQGNYRMNLFNSHGKEGFWLEDNSGGRVGIYVKFTPSKAVYDQPSGLYILPNHEVSYYYDEDYFDEGEDEEATKAIAARMKALRVTLMTIERVAEHSYHYTV